MQPERIPRSNATGEKIPGEGTGGLRMVGYNVCECDCGETRMEFRIYDHPSNPASSIKIRKLMCIKCQRIIGEDKTCPRKPAPPGGREGRGLR